MLPAISTLSLSPSLFLPFISLLNKRCNLWTSPKTEENLTRLGAESGDHFFWPTDFNTRALTRERQCRRSFLVLSLMTIITRTFISLDYLWTKDEWSGKCETVIYVLRFSTNKMELSRVTSQNEFWTKVWNEVSHPLEERLLFGQASATSATRSNLIYPNQKIWSR